MEQAIATAMQNNRDLKISRLEIENADARVDEAYSNAYPSVGLNGRYTFNIAKQVFYIPGQDGIVRPVAIGSDNALQADITVNKVVYNQAAFDAPNTAKVYSQISRQQLRAKASDVILTVKRAYYTAMLTKEYLLVSEQLLANSEETFKNAQALYKAGCTVQQIDQMLGSEGGTYGPSSTAETDTSSETGPFSTADASMTGSDSSGLETSDSSSSTDSSTSGGSVAASDGSSSETSESSSSSGGPEPVCGNGVVEDGETCDDGNDVPDDDCQACAKDSIIFVSSEVYQGFAVGGLLGADQRCRSLAAKANLPRFETFKAWLSTSATSAEKRDPFPGTLHTCQRDSCSG